MIHTERKSTSSKIDAPCVLESEPPNEGWKLVSELTGDLKTLTYDSPELHPDEAAEDFLMLLSQPEHYVCSNPTETCAALKRYIFTRSDYPPIGYESNPHIPAHLKTLFKTMCTSIEADKPCVNEDVKRMSDYLNLYNTFRFACGLWGSTEPPTTISKENLIEGYIPELNLHTGYATPEVVRRVTGDYFCRKHVVRTFDTDQKDTRLHPCGADTTCSSPENPRIIYDDGAAHCVPHIILTADGHAYHRHSAIPDLWDFEQYPPECIKEGRNYVDQWGISPKLLCIGGANVYGTGDVVGDVSRALAREFATDHVLHYTVKTSPDQTDYGFEWQTFGRMRGFIFVPVSLSETKRNELLVVDEQASAAMRESFPFLKEGIGFL